MNLKPAPFALTPHMVGRILGAMSAPRPATPSAVCPNTPPVAADSPTEPARVATMQAIPSAPAEFSPALGRPDICDAGARQIDTCTMTTSAVTCPLSGGDCDPSLDTARGQGGRNVEADRGES